MTIIGNTKIVMAVKKNPSIGNSVVRNKLLSFEETQLENQKCGVQGACNALFLTPTQQNMSTTNDSNYHKH